MANPVEIRDLGIGKLKADAATLQRQTVTVGYQGPEGQAKHPDTDASVAQVAAWMEFGTPGSDDRQYDMPRSQIPSRPFIRTALIRYRAEIAAEIKDAFRGLLTGKFTVEQAQAKVGARMVKAVHDSIDSSRSWAEPLAQSTIDAKGHDQPLVDTRTMRDAASWAVRDGDTIVRQGGT